MNLLDLPRAEFNGYLAEMAQSGVSRDEINFLRREYRKKNSPFSGIFDFLQRQEDRITEEGRRPLLGNLLTLDPSKSGTDRLRSLAIDPGLFAGSIANEIAMGFDAPGAVLRGDVPTEDMLGEAFGTAGTAMLGGGFAPRPDGSVGGNTLRVDAPTSTESQFRPETYYHGTRSDIGAFDSDQVDLGVHVGTVGQANERVKDLIQKEEPVYTSYFDSFNNIAGQKDSSPFRTGDGPAQGAQILPLRVKAQNPLRMADAGEWNRSEVVMYYLEQMMGPDGDPRLTKAFADFDFDELEDVRGQFYENPEWIASTENREFLDEIRDRIKSAGYDSIVYRNAVESPVSEGIQDSLIILDPANVRSVNAKFDPSQESSSDLLSANRSLSLGAGILSLKAQDNPRLNQILMDFDIDPSNADAASLPMIDAALDKAVNQNVIDPRDANAVLARFAERDQMFNEFYSNKSGLGGVVGLLGDEFTMTGDDLRAKSQARARADEEVEMYPGMPYAGTVVQGRAALDDLEVKGFEAGDTTPPTLMDIAQLKDKTIMPVVGDLTSDRIITSINDLELPEAVKLQAGAQFMDKGDQLWASDQGPMTGKLNVARQVEDPVYMHMAMGAKSGDFAKHSGAVLTEMFKAADLTKKQKTDLAELIRGQTFRKGTKTITPFTDFKDFTDPSYIGEYLAGLKAGSNRETFMKVLEKKAAQDLGAPDVTALRLAVTNPELFGTDFLNMGYRFGFPDVEGGNKPTDPSIHTTYGTYVDKKPGTDAGTLGIDVPYTIMMRDVAAARRAEGKGGLLEGMPSDYKTFEMRPSNVQVVDNQLIDEVSKFREIQEREGRERALRYARGLLAN